MHNVLLKRQAILFTPDYVIHAYIIRKRRKISIYSKTSLERLPALFYIQTLIMHKYINGLGKAYFMQTFILVRIPI